MSPPLPIQIAAEPPAAVPRSAATAMRRRLAARRSGIEVALRRALWQSGLRYRLGTIADGTLRVVPDLLFPGPRVCVFVDGCFWHGCAAHLRLPRSQPSYWQAKIERNRRRDQRQTLALISRGWTVVRVWEHVPPSVAAPAIVELVRAAALVTPRRRPLPPPLAVDAEPTED